MKRIFFLGLLVCAILQASSAFAEGYAIDLNIKNETDKHTYYLGEYYGYQQQIIDTAVLVKQGHYRFSKSNKSLSPGIYFITQNTYRIDFIVDQSPVFSIDVDNSDLENILAFKNSEENTLYKTILDKLSPIMSERRHADSLIRTVAASTPTYDSILKQLMSYSETINRTRADFSEKNPKHIMTLMFNAQKEIDVPEAPKNLNEEDGNMWRFQYYKSHFFEYINFSDSRLVRTPILFTKVEQYLNQVVYSQPDSIIDDLKFILEKASASKENYMFLVDYLMLKYERANFVGQDAVWAFLVENYALNGKADWMSSAALNNLSVRLERVKPWLVGQIPPEMWYPDSSNNREFQAMTSLFFSSAPYTVILFWEPDCPHCKSELAKLGYIYSRKNELGIEVISVSRDPDVSKMKKTIEELNLPFVNLYGGGGPGVKRREDVWPIDVVPTLFVLDQDKRIVTKKISVNHLEDVIKKHQK
ncbi:MAG: DUF5106 domain-containing protein [Bacteroidales bacterium]|jgi:peroxiredoxin|nr:DUF5106 domain-containing protein [Bacteroidales bacterium]